MLPHIKVLVTILLPPLCPLLLLPPPRTRRRLPLLTDSDVHECPICLDNPDTFSGHGSDESFGQCCQCGQLFCGPCTKKLQGAGECPTCRASLNVSDEEEFRRMYNLVHTRSPGRHTPVAQCNLGVMHRNGTGVAQDVREAVRLYTLAAAQGRTQAQHNLGIMYDTGTGVAQDPQEAVQLYALAAAQGFVDAQHNLYALAQEAVRLYTLAAVQGHAISQYNLGNMYDTGTGVAQDLQAAVRLYSLAAAQGYANAQFNLGRVHEKGTGCTHCPPYKALPAPSTTLESCTPQAKAASSEMSPKPRRGSGSRPPKGLRVRNQCWTASPLGPSTTPACACKCLGSRLRLARLPTAEKG